jgi:hypothetical protein
MYSSNDPLALPYREISTGDSVTALMPGGPRHFFSYNNMLALSGSLDSGSMAGRILVSTLAACPNLNGSYVTLDMR